MVKKIGKNISERIIQLEWNSVNLEHEFVKLRADQTKNYEVWSVKLSIKVLQMLKDKSRKIKLITSSQGHNDRFWIGDLTKRRFELSHWKGQKSRMPFYMIQDNCSCYMRASATTILVIRKIFVCQIRKSNSPKQSSYSLN